MFADGYMRMVKRVRVGGPEARGLEGLGLYVSGAAQVLYLQGKSEYMTMVTKHSRKMICR
jgi:hypothetical protein